MKITPAEFFCEKFSRGDGYTISTSIKEKAAPQRDAAVPQRVLSARLSTGAQGELAWSTASGQRAVELKPAPSMAVGGESAGLRPQLTLNEADATGGAALWPTVIRERWLFMKTPGFAVDVQAPCYAVWVGNESFVPYPFTNITKHVFFASNSESGC